MRNALPVLVLVILCVAAGIYTMRVLKTAPGSGGAATPGASVSSVAKAPSPIPTPSAGAGASTNATPSPAAPPATTTTPVTVVYYLDNFSRRGDLEDSLPDTKHTNDNTWTLSTDQDSYTKVDGAVTDSYNGYDAAYLPVNETSGVPLDGKQNFTLSATIVPDGSNQWMGIGLNTGHFIINQGNNIFNGVPGSSGGLAAMTVAHSYAVAYKQSTLLKRIDYTPTPDKAYVASITYHAASGTITYSLDGKVFATQTDVKPEQVAQMVAVSMGNGASGPSAKITNFTLTVGGSD